MPPAKPTVNAEIAANAEKTTPDAETCQAGAACPGRSLEHSPGKGGKVFFFALLAWMLLVLPAGSFLYAFVNFFVSYSAVVVASLFGFAILNGCGLALLARWCNCRSPRAKLLAALATGLWSAYLAWVGWVWCLNDFWSMGLIFDPLRLGRVIGFVAADGIRGLGDRIVGAGEWYFWWTLEALVLLLAPVLVVQSRRPDPARGRKFRLLRPWGNGRSPRNPPGGA